TYTNKAIAFIEHSADRPFFLYLATHNIHVPRVPNPRFTYTSACGIRGDSIQELDDSVGKVLATLERLKLVDKTLVIFTSDNGGVVDDGYEDFGSLEHKCNGALRGFKGSLFEGGHRVPLISRWPGHIAEGSENGELITLLDMSATFAALTGVALPQDAVPDGFNVLPALLGEPHEKPARETFIAHNGGTKGPFGIRKGPWKLITGPGGSGRGPKPDNPAEPQLFNLADDLAETKNVAAEHPEIVQELRELFAKQLDAGRSRP
ncbi:MAG TPA: sulfatase-like hydrolase/transferase, partial [Chthoniobacteraceae bacterium]|nr:sulfatase-like hydrolase/transferase [Chthoniobacteraceae bacterium]